MKKLILVIAVIFSLLMLNLFIFSSEEGENKLPEGEIIEEQETIEINTTVSNDDSSSEEMLISLKDQIISFQSNFITWILAALAIISAILIALFIALYNNIRSKTKTVNKLQDSLKEEQKNIEKAVLDVQSIMKSDEYKQKLQELENKVVELSSKIGELEEGSLATVIAEWETQNTKEEIDKAIDKSQSIKHYLDVKYPDKFEEPSILELKVRLEKNKENLARFINPINYDKEGAKDNIYDIFSEFISIWEEIKEKDDKQFFNESYHWRKEHEIY